MLTIKALNSVAESQHQQWRQWLPENAIFNRYEVLHAMETSACAVAETGWRPQHLEISANNQVVGFLPLYEKTHSYGEYMFDWQWVNGFHRAGIAYYPKALAAIPFTPVTGPRLLSAPTYELHEEIINHVSDFDISNFQCLYITAQEANNWQKAGALIRQGYQFSWYNQSYTCFDDFLGDLRAKPRKNIKRERRLMAQSKLSFNSYRGAAITPELWRFFLMCYQRTYLKRSGHEGYLNEEFYDALLTSMKEDIVLFVAEYEGHPLAASLCFAAGDTLYGRYWGTLQEIDGLHFELCYYQGIDYCIANNLQCYHPGTQGDYKRRRGFIPEYTYGAYYFADNRIRPAIENFLELEQRELAMQFDDWQRATPFKRD